jgi:hypothetical protein
MQDSYAPPKNLQSFRDFLDSPEGHRLFKNKYSGDWFIRTHSQELIEAGVLVKLLGKFHVVQPDFVPTLIQLLQDKTRRESISRLQGARSCTLTTSN